MDLENQVYGLLGPNGSGKTTLLRMLAGVLLPTAGKIEIDRNSIGYLPQKFGCFPELTVKEQLEYFACLKKIPKKLHEEEIDLVLDIIHLSDRKKMPAGNCPAGWYGGWELPRHFWEIQKYFCWMNPP